MWPISDQLSSTLGAVPMETEGLETEPHSTVEQSPPSHMELLGTTTTDVQVNKQNVRSIYIPTVHVQLCCTSDSAEKESAWLAFVGTSMLPDLYIQ